MLEQLMRFSSNPLFRFIVLVDGNPLGAFTQCTLPEITWEMTTVQEGGLNTYVHQLPGPRQAASVTLQNGVAMGPDMLAWYISCMQEVYWRRAVTITLLNSLHIPVMTWHIEKCIPKKWAGPQMQTGDNTVAVQTLELACGLITAIPTPFVPT